MGSRVTYYYGGQEELEVEVETTAYLYVHVDNPEPVVGDRIVISGWVRDTDPYAPEYKEVKIWVRPENQGVATLLDTVLTDENGNWSYDWIVPYKLRGVEIAGWRLAVYISYEDRGGHIWVSDEVEVHAHAPTRLGLTGCTSMFAGDTCTFQGKLEYTRDGSTWRPVVYGGAVGEPISIETCVGRDTVRTNPDTGYFAYTFHAPSSEGTCYVKARFGGDVIPYEYGGEIFDLYLAPAEERVDVEISTASVSVSVSPSIAVPGQEIVVRGTAQRGSSVDIVLVGGTEYAAIKLLLGSIDVDPSSGDFEKRFTLPWKLPYYDKPGEHSIAGAVWSLYAVSELGDWSNAASLTVPFPTRITAGVEPSTIHVGEEFKIKGYLQYTGDGSHWAGLPNQELDLHLPGGAGTLTTTTGDDGSYEFTVTAPSAPGRYTYLLVYKGNLPAGGGGGGGGVRAAVEPITAPSMVEIKVGAGKPGGGELGLALVLGVAGAAALALLAMRGRR